MEVQTAQPRCLVGQGRVSLGVGHTCPPAAPGHSEGGGRQPATVGHGVECTDGKDGGVPGGPYGPVPAVGGVLCFAGKLKAGYVVHPVREHRGCRVSIRDGLQVLSRWTIHRLGG